MKTTRPPKKSIGLAEAKRIERKWATGGVLKNGKPLYIVSPK